MTGNLTLTLVGLAAGTIGVVAAGVLLARAGDILAAGTRMGGVWFGMVFLALATSLPELLTSGSAVRLGATDMAAGNLFGSNMANMLILALINLLPSSALFQRVALDQILAAAHAISLTAIASALIVLSPGPLWAGVGPGAVILLVAYVAGSRAIFRYSALARETVAETEIAGVDAGREEVDETGPEIPTPPRLGRAALQFVAGAVLVALAAPLLARSAQDVIVLTGLEESFVGVTVLGVATSLPEVATSMAALRVGAFDLAVANLFGSNAVNVVMFVPLDLLHPPGPILATVSTVHVFTGLASVVMMSLALSAIVFKARRRLTMLEPSSALMMLVYLLAAAVLYGPGLSPSPGG